MSSRPLSKSFYVSCVVKVKQKHRWKIKNAFFSIIRVFFLILPILRCDKCISVCISVSINLNPVKIWPRSLLLVSMTKCFILRWRKPGTSHWEESVNTRGDTNTADSLTWKQTRHMLWSPYSLQQGSSVHPARPAWSFPPCQHQANITKWILARLGTDRRDEYLIETRKDMRHISDWVSAFVNLVENVVSEQFDDVTVTSFGPACVAGKPADRSTHTHSSQGE